MIIAQREEHIKFLAAGLKQLDFLKENTISFIKIIDILLKQEEFPRQNRLLKSLKIELNKEDTDPKRLRKLIDEIESMNE